MLTYKSIEEEFTSLVSSYLKYGYTINTSTMGGTQGEKAKVDLTNGEHIVRIFLEQRYKGFSNTMVIEIRSYPGEERTRILWNNQGDLIRKFEYFEISRGVYTNDEDEYNSIHSKKQERLENKFVSRSRKIKFDADKALNIIKNKDGFKSIKKKNIVSVVRYSSKDDNYYEIRVLTKRGENKSLKVRF